MPFGLLQFFDALVAELDADPLAWQKWWRKHFYKHYELGDYDEDYPESSDKPLYEWISYLYAPSSFQGPTPQGATAGSSPYHSCFARDTKVWTLTGLVPIIEVKPGDRVLSQDPYSGELAYRTVLRVTAGRPMPMVRIGVGGETIQATRGHGFWVCGEGWKMAKELQVAMRLHGVSGAVTVDRVEDAPAPGPWYDQLRDRPDAKPEDVLMYNLVVDQFHTYFVGEGKVLVHDVIPFALEGPVPKMPGLTSP